MKKKIFLLFIIFSLTFMKNLNHDDTQDLN